MPVKLVAKDRGEKTVSREETEAKNILESLFELDENRGAISAILTGMPGSVKTGVMLTFCAYAMNHYKNARCFWRSSMNSPLQFLKLPEGSYRVFCEKDSAVHFIDRKTSKDVTESMNVTYFSSYEELYTLATPGTCSAIFFKDRYLKGVGSDSGNIGQLRFFRFLLSKYEYKFAFFDEYHELVKAGASGQMWREIAEHSNDISNSRKSNLVFFGCLHTASEADYRALAAVMVFIQMHGSRPTGQTPVNRRALAGIQKPTLTTGASGWISCGGSFGRFNVSEVFHSDKSIMAVINKSEEKTRICPFCDRVFLEEDSFKSEYCSQACYYARFSKKNRGSSTPSLAGEPNIN